MFTFRLFNIFFKLLIPLFINSEQYYDRFFCIYLIKTLFFNESANIYLHNPKVYKK